MTKINLLPWRAALRKKRQQEFIAILVGALVLGAATWFGGHMYFADRVDFQKARNRLVQQEITALDARIAKIQDLEKTKRQLISRMEVIQKLQAGRSGVVHLFEELSTTLPEGLHLSSLKQSGVQLAIAGRAESNARISRYMENLDSSDWFSDPKLNVIQVSEQGQTRISSFDLQVRQSVPDDEEAR
ncbi:PilN domain-containing protein [Alkalilimnicola sp. S0819]|uniref:PilN domain-containing protein n=1 Tax=Alkalilimnicola sp. S0819 TaxID=2613922 RepID=UPI001261558D|nr:PilN domain-containing protein [Alkalilimnicola sp. S0819]KAB7624411.1 PilN domain-containing protein [Alkalilimnicola sp. S0819]MPQ16240.1 pilus assembly protein PilN [Alkalilimnicola sp. S0819]